MRPSKNQRESASTPRDRTLSWAKDGKPCNYCGARLRHKYAPGRGKGTRLQHIRWWVCEQGHQIYRKRDQQ